MAVRTMTAEARITARDATGNVFNRLAGKIARVDRQAKVANAAMARNTAASIARAERFSATSGMVGAAMARFVAPAAVGFGVKKLADESISLERTMVEVQKATNASGEDLTAFEQTILDLARVTGKTKEEIGGMMAAAAFAGRPAHELARFTEYAAKATRAWGTNAEETGQAMAILGNIYGANQGRIEEIGDAINTAADISASKESDLLEFLNRAGASARLSRISAEETLAFGAALKEVGVRNEVAATGFEALLNVMKLGAEFSKEAGAGLKALGVDSTKMRKAFVAKPVETMVKLLERLNQISDPMKKAEIMTNIFGKEYQDDISKLLNALPRLNALLGVMRDKTKYLGSVDTNFQTAIDTDVGRIERATQALNVLATRAGRAFKVIAGGVAVEINKLIDAMEKGDGFFQKYTRFVEAQNEARDPDFKRKEADDIARNEVTKKAIVDGLLFPFRWADSQIGGTGNDAAGKGRDSGVAMRLAEEQKIFDRIETLEAERAKLTAPDANVPNYMLDANDRRLRAAEQQGKEIRARRALSLRVRNPTVPDGITRPFVPSGFGIDLPYASTVLDARLPLNAPLPPPRPVDVTGKVEADVTGTINTRHVVEVTASPDLIARITSMSANSTGPVRASAGTSMPHIANPAGR